jgi:Arabinose-binding domain of AraC transcription regulator, N-term
MWFKHVARCRAWRPERIASLGRTRPHGLQRTAVPVLAEYPSYPLQVAVMIDRFRIACTLPRRLLEMGLSSEAVLRRGRLPPAPFDQEKIEVTTAELFALYQAIAETSGDPSIGLKLGTDTRVKHDDPVAIAGLWEGVTPGQWRCVQRGA